MFDDTDTANEVKRELLSLVSSLRLVLVSLQNTLVISRDSFHVNLRLFN